MKKRIVNFFFGLAILIQLASDNAFAAETNALSKIPSCCAKELGVEGVLSDNSLYQLDSKWTTDASSQIELDSLHGRPQIVTMFFANCQFACPILIHDMKRIEAALPENLRTNVGFVLVSFDTERDTTAALAAYRQLHGLAANWTLLHGKPDDVLELGALLGVKFKKETSGQFAHSNVISILDAKGEIISQQIGLNRNPESTVVAVEKLLEVD